MWNLRDAASGWVGDLEQVIGSDVTAMTGPVAGPPFGPLESTDVAWIAELTAGEVVDLVSSRSYVITMPDDRREAMLDDVRRLLATHPDVAGRTHARIPYVARCYRASRPPAGIRAPAAARP